MRGGRKSFGIFVLFIVTGAILGGIIGEIISSSSIMSPIAPYLVKAYPIFDVPPVTVNLYVIKLMIGLAFYPNLASILGIIIAIILFQRF